MPREPQPGEVVIEGTSPGRTVMEKIGLAIFWISAITTLFSVSVNLYFQGRKDRALPRTYVPTAPSPPVAFAMFVRPAGLGQVGALGFINERLEILTVPPNEIPSNDRLAAISDEAIGSSDFISVPGQGVASAASASHFAKAHAVSASAHPSSPVRMETLKPYILHGEFTIVCGPVIGDDSGFSAFLLNKSSLSRATFRISEGTPRGPPPLTRKVYVEGTIREIRGPNQFQESFFQSHTLDLGFAASSKQEYLESLRIWNEEVIKLERSLSIPGEQLKEYSGQLIETSNGRVTRVVDVHGNPLERGIGGEWEPEGGRVTPHGGRVRTEHEVEAPHIVVP